MEPRVQNDRLEAQFSKLKKAPQDSGLSIEGMRLLIHLETERRKTTGQNKLDCRVLDVEQLSEFLQHLSEIKPPAQGIRLQAIVRNGMHYTAVDFKLSPQGNECIILDAANDPRRMLAVAKVMNLQNAAGQDFFKTIYAPSAPDERPRENLQEDFFSCPMFSLDHVCRVSELENIYDHMGNVARPNANKNFSNFPVIHWDMLPPPLVWNAQSNAWLEQYAKMHEKEIQQRVPGRDFSFVEYLEKQKRVQDAEEKPDKAINISTELLFADLSENALRYIKKAAQPIDAKIINPTLEDEIEKLKVLQPKVDDKFRDAAGIGQQYRLFKQKPHNVMERLGMLKEKLFSKASDESKKPEKKH